MPDDARTDPRSPYAASKLSAETYLAISAPCTGSSTPRWCSSNVYGPRQSPEGEAGVVAIFTDALLAGTPTVLYGDGTQTRDYVYVDDVVDGFVRACGAEGNGRRFNLGTGMQTTDREAAQADRRRRRRPRQAGLRPAARGRPAGDGGRSGARATKGSAGAAQPTWPPG